MGAVFHDAGDLHRVFIHGDGAVEGELVSGAQAVDLGGHLGQVVVPILLAVQVGEGDVLGVLLQAAETELAVFNVLGLEGFVDVGLTALPLLLGLVAGQVVAVGEAADAVDRVVDKVVAAVEEGQPHGHDVAAHHQADEHHQRPCFVAEQGAQAELPLELHGAVAGKGFGTALFAGGSVEQIDCVPPEQPLGGQDGGDHIEQGGQDDANGCAVQGDGVVDGHRLIVHSVVFRHALGAQGGHDKTDDGAGDAGDESHGGVVTGQLPRPIAQGFQGADDLALGLDLPAQDGRHQDADNDHHQAHHHVRHHHVGLGVVLHRLNAGVHRGIGVLKHGVILVHLLAELLLLSGVVVDHRVINRLVLQLVIGVIRHRRHGEALVVPIGVGEVFQAVDVVGSEQKTGDGVLLAVQLELVANGQVVGLGEALGEHDLVIVHHVLALENLIGVDLLVPFQDTNGVVLLLHVYIAGLL